MFGPVEWSRLRRLEVNLFPGETADIFGEFAIIMMLRYSNTCGLRRVQGAGCDGVLKQLMLAQYDA
jgi:hypothetical protein